MKKRILFQAVTALCLCLSLLTGAQADTLRPQDDFYAWATQAEAAEHPADNTVDLKSLELPETEGFRVDLHQGDKVKQMEIQQLEELRKHAPEEYPIDSSERTLCQLMQWMTDKQARQAQGTAYLKPVFDQILQIDNSDDFLVTLGELYAKYGVSAFYQFRVQIEDGSSRPIPSIWSTYINFADETDAAKYPELREKHITNLESMYLALGFEASDAQTLAQAANRAEEAMLVSPPELPEETTDLSALEALLPHLRLREWLTAMGVDDPQQLDGADAVLPMLESALAAGELEGLKALSVAYLGVSYGMWMTEETAAAANAVNNDIVFEDVPTASTQHVNLLEKVLTASDAVSTEDLYTLFTEYHVARDELALMYYNAVYDAQTMTLMQEMVDDVMAYYRARINEIEWMSDETKALALNKLNNILVFIGKTDTPVLHDNTATSLIGLHTSGLKAGLEQTVRQLNDAAYNRTVWRAMTYADTANACYYPEHNTVQISMAMMQAPYFSVNYTRAQNLGGTVFILAHEFTHAFDTTGAQYDEFGAHRNWWQPEDLTAFKSLSQQFVTYYERWPFWNNQTQRTELTLNENIADQGAIHAIMALNDGDADAQRTMLEKYASLWFESHSDQYYKEYGVYRQHSFGATRVNATVATLDEFYKLYDVQESDWMYVAPEDRPRLW